MPITVNSLYNDSYNFMRNQISKFVLLALFASIIQFALIQALKTDFKAIDETYKTNFTEFFENTQELESQTQLQKLSDSINNLSPESKSSMLKELMVMALKEYSPSLITELLLISWTVTFIMLVISGESVNLVQALILSASKLPKMLIIGYVCLILILIGFSMLVIPGILLYFALTMAPLIVAASNTSILNSINGSFKLLTRYPGAIISGCLFSIAVSMIGVLLITTLVSPFNSLSLTLFTAYFIQNLVVIFFTLYFYRLYSQVQSQIIQ